MIIDRTKKFFLILLLSMAVSCTFDEPAPSEQTPNPPPPNPSTNIIPNTPTPTDGAINQFLFITLKWECESATEYDVYLGETNPPLIKYATTQSKSYTTPILKYDTKYYWRIVAKGTDGVLRTGPVWNFTTLASTTSTMNGYALIFHQAQTKLPNTVEIVFQVLDLNGSGVSTMQLADFEVFEDELPLSIAESGLTIVRNATVPNTLRTYLMLDNSTSLENDLTLIRNSAKAIVNGIRPNQEVAIYQFSDKPVLIQDFTQNITALKDAIDTKYVQGVRTTDFYGSVKTIANLWEDEYTKDKILQGCLVILSDGEDTQGSTALAEGLHSVHNKLVYTIGVGPALQPEIINAFGTGGSFRLGQEQSIINKFIEVENNLTNLANSFYTLTYNSPKRGNKEHSLKVRVKNNPYQGTDSYISTSFNSGGFTN